VNSDRALVNTRNLLLNSQGTLLIFLILLLNSYMSTGEFSLFTGEFDGGTGEYS
jgi:hypothetical protein